MTHCDDDANGTVNSAFEAERVYRRMSQEEWSRYCRGGSAPDESGIPECSVATDNWVTPDMDGWQSAVFRQER